MGLFLFSATALLLSGAGWAHSIQETMNPANGWLIALSASFGMLLQSLYRIEVRS